MILIIAGPSGSGKTTVGTLLAARLHWPFADADSFHTPASIEKMRRDQPLTDADRWPWLHAIGAWADERNAAGESAILTCSALRRAYRAALVDGRPGVRLVYLLVDRATLSQHLAGRHGHFFPPELLDSQLADQEVPHDETNVLCVTPQGQPGDTVTEVIARVWPSGAPPPSRPPR